MECVRGSQCESERVSRRAEAGRQGKMGEGRAVDGGQRRRTEGWGWDGGEGGTKAHKKQLLD